MRAQRTVESHGNYWLASGEAYGRTVLAEGPTRDEAIKQWVSAVADRQAREQAVLDGRRAQRRVNSFILGEWLP